MSLRKRNGRTFRPVTSTEKPEEEVFFDFGSVTKNQGIHRFDTVPIYIGEEVNHLMTTIYKNILNNTPNEFLVLFKGEFDLEGVCFLGPKTLGVHGTNWYFPKQITTSAHVEIEETLSDGDFNFAIHRHPSGVLKFSGEDERYINRSFQASAIWIPNIGFPDAIVNIPLGEYSSVRTNAKIISEEKAPLEVAMNAMQHVKQMHSHRQVKSVIPSAASVPSHYFRGGNARLRKEREENEVESFLSDEDIHRIVTGNELFNNPFIEDYENQLEELGITEDKLPSFLTGESTEEEENLFLSGGFSNYS